MTTITLTCSDLARFTGHGGGEDHTPENVIPRPCWCFEENSPFGGTCEDCGARCCDCNSPAECMAVEVIEAGPNLRMSLCCRCVDEVEAEFSRQAIFDPWLGPFSCWERLASGILARRAGLRRLPESMALAMGA